MYATVMRFVDHGLPIPAIAGAESAGLKIHAADNLSIPAGGLGWVSTGFVWNIPPGHTGMVAPEHSLLRKGVVAMPTLIAAGMPLDEGLIESVCLHNTRGEAVTVKRGDCVGEVVILPVHSMRGVREVRNPDLVPPGTGVERYIKTHHPDYGLPAKPVKNAGGRKTGGRGRGKAGGGK